MKEADIWRIRGLMESLVRRSGILKATTQGWAEDGNFKVLDVKETSAWVRCNYPPYKTLIAGMEPRRGQKDSLDSAFPVAAELIRLLFYEIKDVSLDTVRVDVYATFNVEKNRTDELCILTTTATRQVADTLLWSNMRHAPERILAHFQTSYNRGKGGDIYPIKLDVEPPRTKPAQIPAKRWQPR